MAIENILFKIIGDSTQARREAKAARDAVVGEAKAAAREVAAATANIDTTGIRTTFRNLLNQVKEFAAGLKSGIREGIQEIDFSSGAAGSSIFSRSLAGITAAAAGAGSALLLMARQAAEAILEIDRTAQATGLSVETVSALDSAFRKAGAGSAAFVDAISTGRPNINQITQALAEAGGGLNGFTAGFNRYLAKLDEAARGNQAARDSFRQLGLGVTRDAEQALRNLIARYEAIPDSAQRATFIQKTFGDGSRDLIPVLNDINGNLDGYIDKLRDLGVIVTPEAVAAAKEYKNQTALLDQQLRGLTITIGSAVLPALNNYLSGIGGIITNTRQAASETKTWEERLKAAGKAALNLISFLNPTGFTTRAILGDRPEVPPDNGPPPPGDLGNTTAAATDRAARARLRALEAQLKEEEGLYRSNAETLRRQFEERFIDEAAFVQSLNQLAQTRAAAIERLLAEEAAVVTRSRLSGEDKAGEFERIERARVEARREATSQIEKNEFDSRQRVANAAIQFQAAQAAAELESLERRRNLVEAALDRSAISYEAAERKITEIIQTQIETRLALTNAEVSRAGENTQARETAVQKVIQLETQLAGAIEQAQIRIQAARARDIEVERRHQAEIQQIRQATQDLQIRLLETGTGNDEAIIRQRAELARQAAGEAFRLVSERLTAELAANELDLADDAETTAQKIENRRRLTDRLIEEARRARAEVDLINRQESIDSQLQDPLSARSLFGDAFANELEATGNTMRAVAAAGKDMFRQLSAGAGNFRSIAGGAISTFTQGLGSMIQAFILSGTTGPAALKKLTAAVLAQIAAQAAVKAIYELAEGFATLFFDPAEAAAHFKAAALYGSVALGAGAIASSIAPAAAGGGPVGNAATNQGQAAREPQESRLQLQSANPVPITTTIVVKHEEGMFVEKVESAITQSFRADGAARKIIRNETAGEPI